MKPFQWLAILGCVSLSAAGLASQGCTSITTVSAGGTGDDNGSSGASSSGASSGAGSSSGASGDDDDSGTTPPQEDSGSTPPSPCLECLYGLCDGLYSLCVGDTGCQQIYQCATAPGCASDATCITNCLAKASASSQALYANLGDCEFEGECGGPTGDAVCAAQCAPSTSYCAPDTGDDGGTDAAAPPSDDGGSDTDAAPPQTCLQCQQAQCITQLAACNTGTACAAYNQCVLGCQTADCLTACTNNSPSGVSAAQALGTCTSSSCPVCAQ